MPIRKSSCLNAACRTALVGLAGVICFWSLPCRAQEATDLPGDATDDIGGDGARRIVIVTPGEAPQPPVFFTTNAEATVQVGSERIEQSIRLTVKVVQGDAKTVSLGLNGKGEVTDVQDENLLSWSVRQEGAMRFLDLQLKKKVVELHPVVKIRSPKIVFPVAVELTHLAPGDSVGFHSTVDVGYAPGVEGVVKEAIGFAPLDSEAMTNRFQTTTGGRITLSLNWSGAAFGPIELAETSLHGDLHANGDSIAFQLRSTAQVTQAGAEITLLSGSAAVSRMPASADYRLRLATEEGHPVYKLRFARAGTFAVALDFAAPLESLGADWRQIDFTVAAGAVVPLTLKGLGSELEFLRDEGAIAPAPNNDGSWLGYLPATGRARIQWKSARKTGEGKLFFNATSHVETTVGAGMLRQDHLIDYQVLQGELLSLSIQLRGPGEILDVEGDNIVAWRITGEGEERRLDVNLSQPIAAARRIKVRSQTPLDAFPVRVMGLNLTPTGAIRHSGYLRLTNVGSVRFEPTGLKGLAQLAPDQFPGEPIQARQTFVYRFPSADYEFAVAADRIQPEVHVSELVLYQLAESDRVVKADIQLDIREAPIREWDFGVPADYSVVSVTGANVADYIAASEATNAARNLRVLFGQDVTGRQLVHLHLEKNEQAQNADWILPRIAYPAAKAVQGNIGVIGDPGFRIAVGETDRLVETPLSYFPKPMPNLQQAFRIREPGWSATMHVERLERNVQSDLHHLYSLSQGTVYGSALINYFVTGAPVSEWRLTLPTTLGNVMVDGQDVRTWRQEGDVLIVSLHQPVMGPYTLLVTFEEKPDDENGSFQAGLIAPIQVQGERGYIQVVSPVQVEIATVSISDEILKLDPLELPVELRLLSAAPPLGTWQYTERPFDLKLKIDWFQPGATASQIVEFSEANSRVSQDGELVTDLLYYVKSRGQRSLKIKLPDPPVRLWEVSVAGQPVTARQADGSTLIPLPGGADPNTPIEVRLRLGKPSVRQSNPALALPIVFAPVLKTEWSISGDPNRVVVPNGGTVEPAEPVLPSSGFDSIAKRGMGVLLMIGALTCVGLLVRDRSTFLRLAGLIALGAAIYLAINAAIMAHREAESPTPLKLSLPILSAGESVELHVKNMPLWRANISWMGLIAVAGGVVQILRSLTKRELRPKMFVRCGGVLLIALGVLFQRDGARWFFALLALATLVLLWIPLALDWLRRVGGWVRGITHRRAAETTNAEEGRPGVVTSLFFLIALGFSSHADACRADVLDGFAAADSMQQQWQIFHQEGRLAATGTLHLTGRSGDRFLLLSAPGILTHFEGAGLRVTKSQIPELGLAYIVTIPVVDEERAVDDSVTEDGEDMAPATAEYQATFEFQLEGLKLLEGIPVLTGAAAVQEIHVNFDEGGWEIASPSAVLIEAIESAAGTTQANVLLGPGPACLVLKPKARDVATEETQYFVEASNLFLPGPGVVDGWHQLHLRISQGQIRELHVQVPPGLTVSDVSGPIGSWQFDAESGRLQLEIEPTQSQTFDLLIETQRGLDPLPADVVLAPLSVAGAVGQVGLVGVAFGPDAQPDKLEPQTMSTVSLADFDASLIPNKQAVLHRVYRYGAEGGELALRVAPVESEVRVASKQAISLGDERVVMGVNFVADISRNGLFQLSFPLPAGFEVESLTGASLHHWAELSNGDQRSIVLHLNGKTLGAQSFSLTLTGMAPTDVGDWKIPRFELAEATRQTGELTVRPAAGIRLQTILRQNVSETDPRTMGSDAQGSLAFRLLQRDWNLVLRIEKLEPWITGEVLHEVTLREGQTRSALMANFHVQNASIRALQIALPIANEDEIKTLRASGKIVSDFVRTAPDSNIWEIRFKRRVIETIQFRIEYERRGNRDDDSENLIPVEFPQARQIAYFFGVRAGGRLEIEHEALARGWQRADWNAVPQTLREAGDRIAPALALRAVAPANPLTIRAKRHSLADSLKLRVASGELTTVLSPTGDQLTAVDLTMEVIQRSSLSVGLPAGGELFSIFVNDESVHSIRQGKNANAWQFYILPGIDDRTAKVRFVYSVPGERLGDLKLSSPQMNVPLERILWHVVAPKGFELTDSDGNLELVERSQHEVYDRDSYLSTMSDKRNVQKRQAAELLETANQLLQAGEQSKARWALNSVANRYALDAASNEDARVQLENLQTQQAIVGLNTRRQRFYLDNDRNESSLADNAQLRQAAADNSILQQDELNFRPQQLSQLLQGNTTEGNAVLQRIAGRLVQHQRTMEPAPQAIAINLPEEGAVYTFARSVQVAEEAPLELDLRFDSRLRLRLWQAALLLALIVALAAVWTWVATRRAVVA